MEIDKASVGMAESKQKNLKGMPYMCQLPEKGWSPKKISDELDILMGLVY